MQTGLFSQQQSSAACAEFEDLVERYYRPLYQFAYSLAFSEADAWDLTQQTFYTWSVKGEQLRDPTKAKSWLFTTLHRTFLQSRRRETRFPHHQLEQADSELPLTLPKAPDRLDSARALTALSSMDDKFRAPISLYYLEDCSYDEIAGILNVPLGTVKSRISRGIVQLQKLLADDERMAA